VGELLCFVYFYIGWEKVGNQNFDPLHVVSTTNEIINHAFCQKQDAIDRKTNQAVNNHQQQCSIM
jgi:hypothetical protein